MSFLNELYTSTRAVIAECWPETRSNGIYEVEHIETIPWKELEPPFSVINIGKVAKTNQFQALYDTYAVRVEVFRAQEIIGPPKPMREQLELLRKALNNTALVRLSDRGVLDMDWSNTLQPNQILIASKITAYRVGMLGFEALISASLDD